MKPTRIFVDCHVFDGTLQGTTTYLKGLYMELIKDADKQFFLAANDVAKLKSVFGQHANVEYLSYKSKNRFFRLLVDIPRMIRKNRIDYAHFQYVVPPVKACKYIATIHDVLFLDFPQYFPTGYKIKNKFLFRWSAKKADVVLTVSGYSKKRIEAHFGIGNIFITPNAVDSIFFETYDKAEAIRQIRHKYEISKYWLFVSRWEPRKNHLTLLKTFVEKGFYKDFHLVFVGDMAIPNPEYDAYFESLDNEKRSKVVSLSKVNFEDLVRLVRGATLSAYPSVAEGFGIPPLEALAANVAAVCSNATAMSDFTFMQDCLFDPLDAEDMTRKINHALAQSDVARQRQELKNTFCWSKSADRFREALSAHS